MELGLAEENILIGRNGTVFEFTPKQEGFISVLLDRRNILVDGLGVGDVGSAVLRDRKHLSEDGIIIVMVVIEKATREIISGPEIVSRGFIYVKENLDLVSEMKSSRKYFEYLQKDSITDIGTMKIIT